MKAKRIFTRGLACALIIVLYATVGEDAQSQANSGRKDSNNPAYNCTSQGSEEVPISFIHFFDWFKEKAWKEDEFVDALDWKALHLPEDAAKNIDEKFYYRQFRYIKDIGIDAIAWEYHPRRGMPPTYPSPKALAALRRSALKLAPFYDLEIAFKARLRPEEDGLPILSNPAAIKPTRETVNFILEDLKQFFAIIPRELLATDRQGRAVIFVFGYGFDDSNPHPQAWRSFALELVERVKNVTGFPPIFYWTSKNSRFAEHLFLHHRDAFAPFHFVVDTPLSQFGHAAVTWNFGFDNLGVQKRDQLLRVIRLDPRYIEEPAWLAAAIQPEVLFVYSWNEPFEGSFLFPSKNWGETKAKLAKYYLKGLKAKTEARLPKTLAIIDDLDDLYTSRKDDWHLTILREILLYPLRRFAPQADVRTTEEVTAELLDKYEILIDLSSAKDEKLVRLILSKLSSHRTLIFDPLAGGGGKLSMPFVKSMRKLNLNRQLRVTGSNTPFFARDDVSDLEPCAICSVAAKANVPREVKPSGEIPLVITRYDDVLVNAYPGNEDIWSSAFSRLYGRPMNESILYGEGLSSQRLEIAPRTKNVTKNTLLKKSVNMRWPIPNSFDWYKLPPEVSPEYFGFIFGIER